MRWSVIVLAAGQGTRMRSDLPKVLHPLAGRPLLGYVLDLARAVAAPERTVAVVGHGADRVRGEIAAAGARAVLQEPQLGTGDAVRVALPEVGDAEGVVVLSGDVPLLRADTVRSLCQQVEEGAAAACLTAILDEPGGYGRVLRDPDGAVEAIIEARDADPDTLAMAEVNAGVYGFSAASLAGAIRRLAPDNAQGEYYLTDVVALLRFDGEAVRAVVLGDPDEMQGVNTRADLARVGRLLNRRVVSRLMAEGVTVLDPETVWVEPGCRVGRDAVLEQSVILRGATSIGRQAVIGAGSVLVDAEVTEEEVVPPLTHRGPW